MGKRKNKAPKQPPREALPLLERPKAARRVLRKVPAWVWGLLVFLGLAITFLEAYPWLSIEESAFLDPSNPYSQMLEVVNTGYLPVTKLDAKCIVNLRNTEHDISLANGNFIFRNFVDSLSHEGRVTI